MPLHSRSVWLFFVKVMITIVMVLCLVYIVFIQGPKLETMFNPVIERIKIVKVEPITTRQAYVWVQFRKVRDCEYIGISWYRGSRTGLFERVAIAMIRDINDLSPPTASVGLRSSGPWRVSISAVEVAGNSFVDIYHRCHFMWITKSEIYP